MRIGPLLFVAALLASVTSSAHGQTLDRAPIISIGHRQIPQELRAAHLAQVHRMKCGDQQASYYREADEWHRIDLDGDGTDEQLVFLTLEGFGGGNNYSRYLIAYRYVEPVWFASTVLLVGGKGNASVLGHALRLVGTDLSTSAMFYGPNDGMCCASVPGRLHFRVGIGGVLEPVEHALSDQAAASRFMLMFVAPCNQ